MKIEKMKNSERKSLARWIRLCRVFLKRPKFVLSQALFLQRSPRDSRLRSVGAALLMKDWLGGQGSFVLVAAFVALSTVTFVRDGNSPMWSDPSLTEVSASSVSLLSPKKRGGQAGVRSVHSLAQSDADRAEVYAPDTGHELIQLLKESDLWDVGESLEIPPVVVASFPADLSGVTPEEKKKAFVHSLLPLVMIAFDEVKQERARLQLILSQLQHDDGYTGLHFSEEESQWQVALSPENVQFVLQMTEKYRTENAAELLKRIDVLPASLVIAQAAIESSWGSSRFAKEANNIFGMWTWGKKGIVPSRREEGKTHKIALYDSVLDSVRAYVLTLNRVAAYGKLRAIRSRTQDPMLISEGLLQYSERGEFYVADVKRVIEQYNLTGYDKFRLALSAG